MPAKKWSAEVTEHSDAMDLEAHVTTVEVHNLSHDFLFSYSAWLLLNLTANQIDRCREDLAICSMCFHFKPMLVFPAAYPPRIWNISDKGCISYWNHG